MRDMAIGVIRAVGVDTGGCNIQFAVDPRDGRLVVIEMNPRVSRSSALASKATGFPIAKIAAKVAIGYTLDEIPNDITKETPASFEPTLDYVVVKVPRFAFEKFPAADPRADHAHEERRRGDGDRPQLHRGAAEGAALAGEARSAVLAGAGASRARQGRAARARIASRTTAGCSVVMDAIRAGATVDEVLRGHRHRPVVPRPADADRRGGRRAARPPTTLTPELLRLAKRHGFSDAQIGELTRHAADDVVRGVRHALGRPAGLQDRRHLRGRVRGRDAVPLLVLRRGDRGRAARPSRRCSSSAAGPNRIGQGIEFDYSCVHASMALSEAGYETVMVNCNPETVSTDYDTSDRLYFEPLTLEDVLEVVHAEQQAGPVAGVRRAARRADAARARAPGWRTPGCRSSARRPRRSTWPRTAARSARCSPTPGCRRPSTAPRRRSPRRKRIADEIGYPVLVRPSYVLGGRGMEIVYDDEALRGLHRAGHRDLARAPGAGRPVPRRRDRDRRRRAVRRRASCTSAA